MRSISSRHFVWRWSRATFAHDLLAKYSDDADCVDHYAAYRAGRRGSVNEGVALDCAGAAAYSACGFASCRCSATSRTIWCVGCWCEITCAALKTNGRDSGAGGVALAQPDLRTIVVVLFASPRWRAVSRRGEIMAVHRAVSGWASRR